MTQTVKLDRKTPRAGRMKPKDRAQQLLMTALSLFAERGFSAKHTDIAERAKVSVPTTFVYFETRAALVDAVLKEVSRFITDELIAKPSNQSSGNEILDCSAALIEAATSHPDHIKVWLMWSVLFEPELHQRYQKFENQILDAIVPSASDNTGNQEPPNELERTQARLVLGSGLMLARMALSGEEAVNQEAFIKLVMQSVKAS